jgi:hypothetical protein
VPARAARETVLYDLGHQFGIDTSLLLSESVYQRGIAQYVYQAGYASGPCVDEIHGVIADQLGRTTRHHETVTHVRMRLVAP